MAAVRVLAVKSLHEERGPVEVYSTAQGDLIVFGNSMKALLFSIFVTLAAAASAAGSRR